MSAEDNNALDLDTTTPGGDPSSARNPLLGPANPLVTDLEQEVLDEYARLLDNVNKLSSALADLAGSPASLTLDGLRMLERKTATVHTLLKASVYSIVLQQQIINEGEGEAQQNNPRDGDSQSIMLEGDETITH
ncbi:hypothetical protein VTN77DRAFT_2353 [Rasamsonia byssochlamydoides]|uniref:uncharacterized protein n=1 Tax=Rasamsonia byssochlamydoides TaxID=89139 RepID=UPI0037432645